MSKVSLRQLAVELSPGTAAAFAYLRSVLEADGFTIDVRDAQGRFVAPVEEVDEVVAEWIRAEWPRLVRQHLAAVEELRRRVAKQDAATDVQTSRFD